MSSKRSSIVHQPQALQAGFLHLRRKKRKRLRPSHLDELASRDGDRVSNFVATDLRNKRVFSPNLYKRSSVPSGEQIGDKERRITANGTCPSEEVGKFSKTAEVRNESISNFNGFVEYDEDRRCNGKSEELVHSTPPDAEILPGGFMVASSNRCPQSSSGGVLGETYAKADCRVDSVTKSRSVLKPCSKRKLFKAPGSIAYKRLLPFLLDSDNYTLQGDPYSKREKKLEKKTITESNMGNRAKESSFVSDTCVKNAVFASGMSCKTTKLKLPLFDNGDAKKFQNSSDSNNDLTLVNEGFGLRKDNVVCASSLDKRLNGGAAKHQMEDPSFREQSKTSGMERFDGGNFFISSNSSSKVELQPKSVSQDVNREDYFNGEFKMSSLDPNVACHQVKEERRAEKLECTRGTDQILGSSTVGENHCNIATESDKKYGPYVKKKEVRNPLVQLKSNYSQVSVSYRRMLPFLEDLFKDNPENCVSGNIDCLQPENELRSMNSQLPSSNFHNSQDKSEGLVSCNMPCDGNSDTLSMPVLNTMNETVCETERVLMLAGVNDNLLSPPKLRLHSEQEMLNKCMLNMDSQLHGATLLNDQAISSWCPAASHEPLTVVTGEGCRMISEQSPITKEDCTHFTDNVSDDAKLSERNNLEPNSSCIEAYNLAESCINVRKGVLKRNPRGCRGMCNCLNCSSFRLHAEKAFEFSRNQLQDAEKVASDLMKELSCLRDVLEKCSDGAKGDAGYHSNKMIEACRKALEAELVAKGRLLQMNYELDIHCRIACSQRPSVRFSSEVEKRGFKMTIRTA